jgi:GNAT superfamily N-acetyltransferase
MSATVASFALLADRPDLAPHWAALHWREWGKEAGREELSWWVEDASKATQRTHPPVALIALGHHDEVLGGVGVHPFDLDERRDRSPWVVGMIVRADRRGEGIGQALLAQLEAWAGQVGIEQLWVCTETEGRTVSFYLRCGYERVEDVTSQTRGLVTILTKRISRAYP